MSHQSQPLRIESAEFASFGTARTMNSRLWFVNNDRLEHRILGKLAQYANKYNVVLYAFVMQGNHFHLESQFPETNRACFYRDFNARVAEAVRDCVRNYPGGALFARRYSEQALPLPQDIEERFFYCALQPVSAGLVENPLEYPGYNSFLDAISGRERLFKVVDYGRYRAARRFNPDVDIENYTTRYTLKYARLPGYENLSQAEYKSLMLKKYHQRRLALVKQLRAGGWRFSNGEQLRKQQPGSSPKNTKTSKRNSYRPLVLSVCAEAKRRYLEWYFSIYGAYKRAARVYLDGIEDVLFPPGTFKPPKLTVSAPATGW